MNEQTPLFPEPIDGVKGRYWLTPPDLMARLREEFRFDFDAAPYPRPAGFDALKAEWGERTWLNPPIEKGSSISAWVKKAVEENTKGKLIVAVLPFPRWMRYLVQAEADFRFPGPIHFLNPQGQPTKSEGGGHIPDIIVILQPQKSDSMALTSKPTAGGRKDEGEGA